jgi:hypothetical protein
LLSLGQRQRGWIWHLLSVVVIAAAMDENRFDLFLSVAGSLVAQSVRQLEGAARMLYRRENLRQ